METFPMWVFRFPWLLHRGQTVVAVAGKSVGAYCVTHKVVKGQGLLQLWEVGSCHLVYQMSKLRSSIYQTSKLRS